MKRSLGSISLSLSLMIEVDSKWKNTWKTTRVPNENAKMMMIRKGEARLNNSRSAARHPVLTAREMRDP